MNSCGFVSKVIVRRCLDCGIDRLRKLLCGGWFGFVAAVVHFQQRVKFLCERDCLFDFVWDALDVVHHVFALLVHKVQQDGDYVFHSRPAGRLELSHDDITVLIHFCLACEHDFT